MRPCLYSGEADAPGRASEPMVSDPNVGGDYDITCSLTVFDILGPFFTEFVMMMVFLQYLTRNGSLAWGERPAPDTSAHNGTTPIV